MGNKTTQVTGGDVVFLQYLGGCLDHLADGVFVNCLPILVDIMHPGRDGLGGRGKVTSSGGHIERRSTGTINLVTKVDQPYFTLLGGLDQHCAGAISENDAGGAVGVIDD